jgi:hypothetical protein
VVDRLRALLEDPHDPAVARAVVLLACAVTLGLTIVVGSGGAGSHLESSPRPSPSAGVATAPARQVAPPGPGSAARHGSLPRQDPQDRPGSSAAHRARRELASHRALQHVPYRRDRVRITLVGTHGPLAVLGVEALSLAAARRGWRTFLRAYRDDGDAYLPRLGVRGAVGHAAAHPALHPAADRASRPSTAGAAIARPDADRRVRDLPTSPHPSGVGP